MTPAARVPHRRRHPYLVASLVAALGVVAATWLGPTMTGTASAGSATVLTAHQVGGQAVRAAGTDSSAWVGTWATAAAAPAGGEAIAGFTDTTLRQRIHVSVGGELVRLRLTNVYGRTPLSVTATLARPSARAGARPGDIDPTTLVPVTFGGRVGAVVPTGTVLTSDPVRATVADDGDLLVSLHVPGPTGPATYHPAAFSTGWLVTGDQTSATSVGTDARRTGSFWFLDGLDVRSDAAAGAVAVLGDSITDGSGTPVDADHRWTDRLADRLLAEPTSERLGVLNAGIGGNRLLLDAAVPGRGARAVDRLTRDVLTRTGVTTLVVEVGVNDLQLDPTQQDPRVLVEGYRQVLARAHARGLRVVVGTITPFEGWGTWTTGKEEVRVAVNDWIRTSGEPDAVLDADAALRDPFHPARLRPDLDSGDHLHPDEDGYAAMAAAVDLTALHRPRR